MDSSYVVGVRIKKKKLQTSRLGLTSVVSNKHPRNSRLTQRGKDSRFIKLLLYPWEFIDSHLPVPFQGHHTKGNNNQNIRILIPYLDFAKRYGVVHNLLSNVCGA